MNSGMKPPAATFDIEHGLIWGHKKTGVYGVKREGGGMCISTPGTSFGINLSWDVLNVKRLDGIDLKIPPHWYFSVYNERAVVFQGGTSLVVHHDEYRGLTSMGGPLESKGRLKYIDGCSDTLLVSPVILGDPCFNLLHFPKNITQTPHTHPSIRCGVIHEGGGECVTESGTFPLKAGRGFVLWPDAVHSFNTRDREMTLTVFHPDSDFGPTHENHPMLNRTIVDGVSAANIERIRTKVIS